MNDLLNLVEVKNALDNRELSSQELVSEFLEKIKRLNPILNVFLVLNDAALRQAEQADKRRSKNKKLPLLGIPFAIKDNFLTEGLVTTASSKVLANYQPPYSATVVDRLEKAGAIILGKTNMDAWAHGSSTETSDYGSTKNPWNVAFLPGGSSGGSAAAVSADLCTFAIGSETAGSIRQPAAWCGCVGLKPTYGRVSRYGLVAMGSSLDCPGPMTKTVADAAYVLEIIAGKDIFDATSSPKLLEKYSDYLNGDIKNLKIGIAEKYLLPQMDLRVKQLIKGAGRVLENLGAKVEMVSTMDPEFAIGVYTVIQRSEVSSNLGRYDGIRYGHNRTYFGQEAKRRVILGTFALSAGYADKYYKKAQQVRTLFIKDFEKIFQKYDLLIGPTSPGPAKKIGATQDQAMFGEMEDILLEPSSIAGLPGISVPCGFVNNLPIGLNIFGPQFSEKVIIQVASAYEKETNWRLNKPCLTYNEK